MGKATAMNDPAWHDSPTGPGFWFCPSVGLWPYHVMETGGELTAYGKDGSVEKVGHRKFEGKRWYGPCEPKEQNPANA